MPATPSAWSHAPRPCRSLQRAVDQRLARQVAQAAGSFEHRLLGRAPTSVTVVTAAAGMVVSVHESLSPIERLLSAEATGSLRVRDYHRSLFESTVDALCDHVRHATGVQLAGGMAHVDTASGTMVKTLVTPADIELFLLGEGLPGLGVPVNAHVHAQIADGNGSARH